MPPSSGGQATVGDLLVRLGVDLSGFVGGFAGAEHQMERFGTRMYFLGSRITMGFSAPIAAAAVVVARLGLAFDAAMTESLAIMGEVSDKMRSGMEQVARDVTKYSKFSAEEAARAYYALASAGLNAEEAMKALPVVVQFAQAGVMDLAKASEYLAGATAALGLKTGDVVKDIENMRRVSDVLTEANNRALGTVEDFAAALTNKAAAAMRMYKVSVEEGVAVLMAYAAQNIKGRLAGQQFYMFLRDISRSAATHSEAFRKLGIAVFEASGKLRPLADIIGDLEKRLLNANPQQQTMIYKMLGINDRARAATQALIGFSDQIRINQAYLEAAGGVTERVAQKQMKSMTNQLLQMTNQFKVVGIEIFSQFAPVVRDVVLPLLVKFQRELEALSRALAGMGTGEKTFWAAMVGLAAVLGPVIAMTGSFVLMVRAITGPMVAASGAIYTMATAQTALAAATAVATGKQAAHAVTLAQVGASAQAAATGIGALNLALIAGIAALSLAGIALAVRQYFKTMDEMRNQFKTPERGRWTPPAWLLDEERKQGKPTSPFDVAGGETITLDAIRRWQEATKGVKAPRFAIMGKPGELFDPFEAAFDDFETKTDAHADRIANLLSEMVGGGGKKLAELMEAFKQLTSAEKSNATVVANVWRMYKGLREDLSAKELKNPIEEFTASIRDSEEAQANIKAWMESMGGTYDAYAADLLGVSEAAYKFAQSEDEIEAVISAFGGVSKIPLSYYKKHKDELLELGATGKDFGRSVNAVIAQCIELAKAGAFSVETIGKGTSKAAQFVKETADDIAATLKDKRSELELFNEKYADTELVNLQKGLSALEHELQNKIEKMIIAMAEPGLAPAIQLALLRDIEVAKQRADAIIDTEKDIGISRLLYAEITNRKLIRYVKDLEVEEKLSLYRRLRAQEEYYKQVQKVVGIVSKLGDLFDAMGKSGLAEFFHRVGSAMTIGAEAASGLADTFQEMQWIWASMDRKSKEVNNVAASGIAKLGAALKEGAADWITFGLAAMTAMEQATSGATRMQNVIGGATTGAAIGAKGGWMGALAGAAIGAIYGAFQATEPNWEKLGIKMGKKLGITITATMAKQMVESIKGIGLRNFVEAARKEIGENAKPIELTWKLAEWGVWGQANYNAVMERIAEALNLGSLIEAQGGLGAENIEGFTQSIRELIMWFDRGVVSYGKTVKAIEEAFSAYVDYMDQTGGLASDQMLEIIRLAEQYGLRVKAITDYLKTAFTGAVAGLNTYFQTWLDAQKGIEDTGKELGDLDEQIEEINDEIKDLSGRGELGVSDTKRLEELKKQLAELQKQRSELQKQKDAYLGISKALMATKEGALAVAAALGASFRGLLQTGMSPIDIVKEMEPTITALEKQLKELGIWGGEVFDSLRAKMALLKDPVAGPILQAMVGLGAAIRNLYNAGQLTPEMFSGLAGQIAASYARLKELGFGGAEALELLQPDLQLIWEMQKKFGWEVDEATQAMLDEAAAAGLIGEAFKSPQQQMIDGINKIADAMAALLTAFGIDLPKSFEEAEPDIQETMDDIGEDLDPANTDIEENWDESAEWSTYRWEHWAKIRFQNMIDDAKDTAAELEEILSDPFDEPAPVGPQPPLPGRPPWGPPIGGGDGDGTNPNMIAGGIEQTITVNLDGRTIAQSTARHLPRVLRINGAV